MIIVMIIFSLLYIILLTLILIAYYRDVSDIEKRILYLEKRINKIENNKIFNEVSEEDIELLKRYDTVYKNWIFSPIEHGLNINGESFSKPKEKKNNNQRGCDCEMACKKGRGGRKK